MAKLSKDERKARLQQLREADRTELIESMPLSPKLLNTLLGDLDANLKSCDHTTMLTEIFLDAAKLDKSRVLPWLADHGGYCDCEVLSNLCEVAESFHERPIPPPKPKQQRLARDLGTITGWDLKELPHPWRIANLFTPDQPLQIQLGKKGDCTITVVESPLPPSDGMSDEYWSQLWYARTDLPVRSPIRISHGALEIPIRLRSILVQTPSWTPVYCWVVPENQEWYLEIRTESNRQHGDLKQVCQLITGLDRKRV